MKTIVLAAAILAGSCSLVMAQAAGGGGGGGAAGGAGGDSGRTSAGPRPAPGGTPAMRRSDDMAAGWATMGNQNSGTSGGHAMGTGMKHKSKKMARRKSS